jgi:glycerophosphoryl diester phosphodiesterase
MMFIDNECTLSANRLTGRISIFSNDSSIIDITFTQRIQTQPMKNTILAITMVALATGGAAQYTDKTLIAHRGASSYAPEHTLEAYKLALEQKADYVEQDLQITKDGVLVCLHDLTLERTTNVEEVFPQRFVVEQEKGRDVKHWYAADFTLAEIKQLDAGSWFNPKFKGSTVPTWQEAIDLVRPRAGLYPETKEPEVYGSRGFDMERLVMDALRRNALDGEQRTVIIQSFSAKSLERLRQYGSRLPHVLLISDSHSTWVTEEGMKTATAFANGIGPSKEIIMANPSIVGIAHRFGLSVTPYTFHSAATGRFNSVRDEMAFFLDTLDVDALFTDNPDMFPRAR